ncbi:hypothetical protein [Aquicoccus porphyridii]|uniref:hypothetical protein n=1 Tax=Aquicoccus porphyridii TaxID=1852029 RepID=UPI00273F92E1|nr:hypothetical protein [Aquicoccus porphyridii]
MALFPRKWLSLILLATCCMTAKAAMGETIRVRGGEHEGFTRLALDLPRRLAWRVVEHENSFELMVEGDDLTFDLSAALSRLNATRIGTVEQGRQGGVLEVGLNCECGAEAFLFDDTMLVVDIRERRSGNPNTPGRDRQIDFLTTFWIDTAVIGAKSETTPAHGDGPKQADEGNEKENDAQNRTFEAPRSASRETVDRPDTDANVPPPENDMRSLMNATRHAAEEQRPEGVNLAIRNGAAPFEPQDRLAAMTAAKEEACLKEKDLNITDWARDGHFSASVGRLRSELYGEFDRSRHDIALELAKAYIFFGFGSEARVILDEFVDDADHLKNIASLIETGTVSGENMFADALSCDNAAALWSMLSHDAGEIGRGFDPSPVLMAFDRLPAALRSHLAGNLSERFRSLDMLEDAGEILRIAARSGVAADSNAQFASALVQKDENRKDDASATLTGLAEQSYETSPRAMIELVSLKMGEDGSIDYDTAQMARILRKEHAKSDLLPDLHFATVVALALSGAYAEALDELEGLRANIGDDAFRQAQDFLHDRISRKATDPVFLSAVLTLSPDAVNELAPGTVFKAAKRLVALGFPDAAVDLLGPRFRGHDTPEGRLLRAEAHLHLGHADMAKADLSGIEGARADRLRAAINEAKPDFGQAPDGNFPAPDRDAAEIPDKTAPLEFSRKSVDASADTRRRVEALLAGAPLE